MIRYRYAVAGPRGVCLAVATDRSFLGGGASRLHRTQPAVSQAVKRIEDELGERLFDRSSQ